MYLTVKCNEEMTSLSDIEVWQTYNVRLSSKTIKNSIFRKISEIKNLENFFEFYVLEETRRDFFNLKLNSIETN